MFDLKTIVNKYPFMYEIGDTVYYIGYGVFQVCSDQRSFFEFNRYRDTLTAIGRERLFNGELTPSEVGQLVNTFKQVRKMSNHRNPSDEDAIQAKKRFEDAADRMSASEKTQLTEQLTEFIWIYKLSERL